jgi:hypothetical protein
MTLVTGVKATEEIAAVSAVGLELGGGRDLYLLNRKHHGVQINLHGTGYGSAVTSKTSIELLRLTKEKRERDRNHIHMNVECSPMANNDPWLEFCKGWWSTE